MAPFEKGLKSFKPGCRLINPLKNFEVVASESLSNYNDS